jgi:hypothetical protein
MFIKGFEVKTISQIKANLVHFIENYSINDPTTPDLKVRAPLPVIGNLKFAVKDMSLQPTNPNEQRAANCFLTVGTCISNTQSHLNAPLKKWAACNLLQVYPAAGSNLNAYYDRSSIRLFYYNFNRRNFYFGDSADIVTHELGHAILDAMRPDFWSVQSLEIWSFHEAFSDILALFNLMSYDVAIKKALEETQGNLSLSNSISRLAEEVGVLIRNVTKDDSYLSNALRDPAVENFKYVDPSKLPEETDNNKLAAECHSFGRVFSNAWYNIFVRIFNYHVSLGEDKLSAVKKARDVAFSSLIQAVPHSPRVVNYYEAIAKCMIATANAKNPVYGKIVKNVFVEWNILQENSLKILSDLSWKQVVQNLKKEDMVFKNKLNTIVTIRETSTLSASDLPILSNLSIDKDFKVEVASDSYYEFDNRGFLSYEVSSTQEQVKNSAAQCLLSVFKSIGKNKMWKIENGRLLRNFIS